MENKKISKYSNKQMGDDKVNLNITAFNIDSRYRNKNPKNVVDKKIFYLKKNDILFTENSSIVEIKINNNDDYFDINDRIKINNFKVSNKIINNNLYLINQFNYLVIKIDNHNIKSSKENQFIKLNFINETPDIIGNIPINSLTQYNTIYTVSDLEENMTIPVEISENFENIHENLIFIELPFLFIGENRITMIENIVEFEFDSFAGIPDKYINSDYPITFKNNKAYHMITDVTSDSIFIDLNLEANQTIAFNEDGVVLSKILKVQEGFTDSNYYIINLPKNFTNVVRIELISSEFFFADTLIKSSGPKKNNLLYWQNLEDGDTIYSVEIDAGNYSPSNLLTEIINKTNIVKRKNYSDQNPIFNYFEIELNADKQMIIFNSFKYDVVPNSITINVVQINNDYYYMMTIKHPNNFVEVGDTIEITNSEKVNVVPANIINTSHIVYQVDKKTSTYDIILPRFNAEDKKTGFGGETVTIKSRNLSRLLFDKKDTIGEVLGFKNVGEENAITNYSHVITNKDPYIRPTIYNSIGEVDDNIKYLNFTGDNLYLLMYLNDYKSIYSNSTVEDAFAKILLPGTLGDAVFNTFVNYPVEFDIPIPSIDQFVVRFLYPDGSMPEFNNLEHSFTLLITELNKTNEQIGTQSNNSSFVKELYDIKHKEFIQ